MRLRILMGCVAAGGLLAACGSDEAEQAEAPAPANEAVIEMPTGPEAQDSGASLVDVALDEMNGIAAAIESAVDEASAEEAAQSIRASGARLRSAADAAGVNLSDPAVVAVFAPRQAEFAEVGARLNSAAATLQTEHPDLVPVIEAAMAELPGNQPR